MKATTHKKKYLTNPVKTSKEISAFFTLEVLKVGILIQGLDRESQLHNNRMYSTSVPVSVVLSLKLYL